MLTQVSKTGKVLKEVFIIRRYEIKRGKMAGSICNVVRSIKTVKGQQVVNEYQVWTYADGTTTCDCPASGNCCHRDEVEFAEMRRCNSIKTSLLEQVNTELAKFSAPAATQEEIVTTQATLLRPDDPDQIAYFVQQKRRSDEYAQRCAINPVPTPTVRNVSRAWLLKGNRGGTFSGRAQEVA